MADIVVVSEQSGIIGRHTSIGWTGEEVNLGDFNQVAGDKGTLIKLHASFMVLSWLLFANLGTFVARYCKNIFMVSDSCNNYLNEKRQGNLHK